MAAALLRMCTITANNPCSNNDDGRNRANPFALHLLRRQFRIP
jgi:hypothetical protein